MDLTLKHSAAAHMPVGISRFASCTRRKQLHLVFIATMVAGTVHRACKMSSAAVWMFAGMGALLSGHAPAAGLAAALVMLTVNSGSSTVASKEALFRFRRLHGFSGLRANRAPNRAQRRLGAAQARSLEALEASIVWKCRALHLAAHGKPLQGRLQGLRGPYTSKALAASSILHNTSRCRLPSPWCFLARGTTVRALFALPLHRHTHPSSPPVMYVEALVSGHSTARTTCGSAAADTGKRNS